MTDNIELPPLPILPQPDVYDPGRFGTAWGDVKVTDYAKDYARAAIRADRARQAPAPVEVSRLAEAGDEVLFEVWDDHYADVLSHDRPPLDYAFMRKVLALASTPVGEVPAECKLVPLELTDEMVIAACKAGHWRVTEYSVKDVRAAYAAMLAVAEPAHVAKEAQGVASC